MTKQASPILKKASTTGRAVRTSAPAPELTPLQDAAKDMELFSTAFRRIAQINAQAVEDAAPFKTVMENAKARLNRFADSAKDGADFANGKNKSMKLAGGIIGWKAGTKAIVMPEVGDIEKNRVRLLENFLKTVEAFMPDAVSKVVDSKKVIMAWDDQAVTSQKMVKGLKKLGIDVTQKDNFFVTASK